MTPPLDHIAQADVPAPSPSQVRGEMDGQGARDSKSVRDGSADQTGGFEAAAARVARCARSHAAAVDRDGVPPAAAIEAMRRERLLGMMVPEGFGGGGAPFGAVAQVANVLGQACGATAMIFAMHQIQAACLIAHHGGTAWQGDFLRRVADEQMLLASVTSEVGVGGNIRRSRCAVSACDGVFTLRKEASAVSYGAVSDALLMTARRAPDAAPSDQVLVVLPRDGARMQRVAGWDPMGMRGTCTESFVIEAAGELGQILDAPFADIASATMLPVSHVLWGCLWMGIAGDAIARAREFQRRMLADGATDPGTRLVDAVGRLQMLRARLRAWVSRIDVASPATLSMTDTADINTLKILASETCLDAAREAMLVCGFAGYQNDSPYSVSRHLRDLQSAPLMIANDRMRASTANLLLGPKLQLGVF